MIGGAPGAYSNSQGVLGIRKNVADFIQRLFFKDERSVYV